MIDLNYKIVKKNKFQEIELDSSHLLSLTHYQYIAISKRVALINSRYWNQKELWVQS